MSALMMPPQPTGTVREQLLRQYSYLFQMAQQLNLALEQLEQGTAQPQQGITSAAQPQEQQYRTLKSMVIQTAQQVRQEMDRLAARLEGEYVAVSDFGTYVERLNNYIENHPHAEVEYLEDPRFDGATLVTAVRDDGVNLQVFAAWQGRCVIYQTIAMEADLGEHIDAFAEIPETWQ